MDDSYGICCSGLLFGPEVQVNNFSKDSYCRKFDWYRSQTKETLNRLKKIWRENSNSCEEILDTLANNLVNEIASRIPKPVNRGEKNMEAMLISHYRSVIALYLLPLLKEMHREYADYFADRVYEHWLELFPTQAFESISYSQLIQGFTRRPFGCYITSAVCTVLNRGDDCYELSAFRKFRDDYLLKQPDGKVLIREYYETAPKIVEKINELSDSDLIYCQLWEDDLSLCLEEIEEGDYESCKKRYVRMVRRLQEKYLD